MSQDRDPFELLPRFVDPEPDSVVMTAVIAQSRDAFANRQAGAQQNGTSSPANWFRTSALWLIPSGAVAAAVVVAVMVVPNLGSIPPDNRDIVADSATDPASDSNTFSRGPSQGAGTAPQPTGTRMGMQPPPGAGQLTVEPLPQVVSSFKGEGVLIGMRLDAEALEIYLPDITGEQMVDAQSVMPGEQVEILSAFARPDTDLIAVQFRVDDIRFWRIYHLVEDRYRRDPERSRLVSDAADRAEVEDRLDASE